MKTFTKFSIAAISAGALSLAGISAWKFQKASQGPFLEYCRTQESLAPDLRHTVEVLLKATQQSDCLAASRSLQNLSELNLSFRSIKRLDPLAGLENLEKLDIMANEVEDISPLRSLTRLTTLFAGENKIRDLSPIKGLPLKLLSLSENGLEDASELQSIRSLQFLDLASNKLTSFKNFCAFDDLLDLDLTGNGLDGKKVDVACIKTLMNLSVEGNRFELSEVAQDLPKLLTDKKLTNNHADQH